MSGKLHIPATFEVGGNRYIFSSIGFYEDGRVSGGKPIAHTPIIEDVKEMIVEGATQDSFDGYTVTFTRDGKIVWADLADGTNYQRGT